MAKSFNLEGLVNPEAKSGAEAEGLGVSKPKTRPRAQAKPKPAPEQQSTPVGPPKRLSLTLDAETYRQLRLHAVETDRTHQAILEEAARAYLRTRAGK